MAVHLFHEATQALLGLFYPDLCEGCGRDLSGGEHTFCLHCVMHLPRTGFHDVAENAAARIFTGRVPIERATSFVYFSKQGFMQHLLHRFKYNGRTRIGVCLGALFATELKQCNWHKNIDMIIPVPLHRSKEYKRGYNQSSAFADGMALVLQLPVRAKGLRRSRNTVTQTRMSRAQRIDNVSGVFDVLQPVAGKHVLLVDDVLTTGATLEACAQALLAASAAKVSVATIALATDG